MSLVWLSVTFSAFLQAPGYQPFHFSFFFLKVSLLPSLAQPRTEGRLVFLATSDILENQEKIIFFIRTEAWENFKIQKSYSFLMAFTPGHHPFPVPKGYPLFLSLPDISCLLSAA